MNSSISILAKCSIVAVMFAAGFTAQVIRIRVIDANNGHPLVQQNVSVALLYGKDEKAPAKYGANLNLETDANGEAQFHLPEPAPVHFSAHVRLTSEPWHCRCISLVTTQDVLQKGSVQALGSEPTGSATNAKPEPGVILFFRPSVHCT
jgi:hypothetical protein